MKEEILQMDFNIGEDKVKIILYKEEGNYSSTVEKI